MCVVRELLRALASAPSFSRRRISAMYGNPFSQSSCTTVSITLSLAWWAIVAPVMNLVVHSRTAKLVRPNKNLFCADPSLRLTLLPFSTAQHKTLRINCSTGFFSTNPGLTLRSPGQFYRRGLKPLHLSSTLCFQWLGSHGSPASKPFS